MSSAPSKTVWVLLAGFVAAGCSPVKAHYVGVDVVSINIETSAVSALVDGTLIVHSTNGGRNQGGLHAVDPETAQVIWEVFGGPGAPGFTTVRDTIWRVDGELLYGFGPDGTATLRIR